MRPVYALIIFLMVFMLVTFSEMALAVDPAYREIRASAEFGGMFPSGEWKDLVKSSEGFGADIGISLSRRITTGFTFSYYDAEPSDSYDPGPRADITGFQWSLYTFEVFTEYLLSENDFSPFVGGQMGVHFTHIDYINLSGKETSMGDHGLGYTLLAGARYRISQKTSLLLRVNARQTPGLYSGWRTSAHVGVSIFM